METGHSQNEHTCKRLFKKLKDKLHRGNIFTVNASKKYSYSEYEFTLYNSQTTQSTNEKMHHQIFEWGQCTGNR